MGVLRSNASVRNLFLAQNISVMGDYFTYVALVGLIKEATDSTFLVSLVYAAYVLPSFFSHQLLAQSLTNLIAVKSLSSFQHCKQYVALDSCSRVQTAFGWH